MQFIITAFSDEHIPVVIQVIIFWVMTPCSGMVGYEQSHERWRQQVPSKCWYPTTTLHSITTHKNTTWIL